jgi:hypothetical protein
MVQGYGDGWRAPLDPLVADRKTALMLKMAKEPLAVDNPDAARLKRTYVFFIGKPADSGLKPIFDPIAARVHQAVGSGRIQQILVRRLDACSIFAVLSHRSHSLL